MIRLSYKEIISVAVLLAVIGVLGLLWQRPWQTYGSVEEGSGYVATSTGSTAFANYSVIQSPTARAQMTPTGTRVATSAPTFLGSVVITTPGAAFCLYDATSTVPNGEWATTTIACFGASAAAGTYTFDSQFSKGVLLENKTAPTVSSWASTTITFR